MIPYKILEEDRNLQNNKYIPDCFIGFEAKIL